MRIWPFSYGDRNDYTEATILPARPALVKLPQNPGLHGVKLDNSVGPFRRALRYAFYDCTREMPKSKPLLTWAPFCCRVVIAAEKRALRATDQEQATSQSLRSRKTGFSGKR
jgi:hypothetical protein